MTKIEKVERQIIKIINKSQPTKFNNIRFVLKLDDKNTYNCFLNHEPYIGDIILGTIDYTKTKTIYYNNEDEYTLTKPIVKLPDKKEEQINRIKDLLLSNNINYKINDIEQIFLKFKFGKKFWFHLYKHFSELDTIDGYKIPLHLEIISNHISQYTYDMLKNFKDMLQESGVYKLTQKQLLELYVHPKFGFDISNWKFANIINLLSIDGFGINALIKISKVVNSTLDEISQLIILYSLYKNHNGNTCIQYDYKKWKNEILNDNDIIEILKDNNLFENLTNEKFTEIINELIENNKIVKIDNLLYGKTVYDIEYNIALILNSINYKPNIINKYNLSDNEINKLVHEKSKQKNKFNLNQEQKQGIYEIFNNNVSVIYGKAGTGKTSLLSKFVDVYQKIFVEYDKPIGLWFFAPTGKAKIKIEDSLSQNIGKKFHTHFDTIHAFNFKNKPNKKFNIESEDLGLLNFNHNIFVIDESSMVDIYLLDNFLNIIKKLNCTVVFLGDNRQLPSVGPGCILDKLISCNVFKITELAHVVRNGGNITKILDKVIEGININITDCDDKNQFTWLESKTDNEHELLIDIINKNSNNMIIGTTNNIIEKMTDDIREIKNPQNKVNPIGEYVRHTQSNNKIMKTIYRIGDPVIHRKNNNSLGLANGTQGVITNITYDVDNKVKYVQVKYKRNHKYHSDSNISTDSTNDFLDKDYRIVNYDVNTDIIKYLEPAYMITAHKSQGQEYPNIVVILTKSILLNRNILYTALSRAQKSIILISTQENLKKCIKKKIKRNSLLDYMFKYQDSNDITEFSDYYLKSIGKDSNLLDDIYEKIQFNGQNYVYNKETSEVFLYNNNIIGELYGMYNEVKNKIIKYKQSKIPKNYINL